MVKKVIQIFLGVIIGGVIIGIVWFLITGLNSDKYTAKEIVVVKENLLSGKIIEKVKSRTQQVNLEPRVGDDQKGRANPFK